MTSPLDKAEVRFHDAVQRKWYTYPLSDKVSHTAATTIQRVDKVLIVISNITTIEWAPPANAQQLPIKLFHGKSINLNGLKSDLEAQLPKLLGKEKPPLFSEEQVALAKTEISKVLSSFHRSSCYPEAMPVELDQAATAIIKQIALILGKTDDQNRVN